MNVFYCTSAEAAAAAGFCVILLFGVLPGSSASITTRPQNLAVDVGSVNTTMPCASADDVSMTFDWYLLPFNYPLNDNTYYFTENGVLLPPYTDYFALNKSAPGIHDLVIFQGMTSPQPPDAFTTAGEYHCYQSSGLQTVAQLIVVQSKLSCRLVSTTSGSDEVSCVISYAAAGHETIDSPIDAILTWSVDGQLQDNTPINITTDETTCIVTATSTITVDQSNIIQSTYKCSVAFSQPKGTPPESTATNAPVYSDTCNITGERLTTSTPSTLPTAVTSPTTPVITTTTTVTPTTTDRLTTTTTPTVETLPTTPVITTTTTVTPTTDRLTTPTTPTTPTVVTLPTTPMIKTTKTDVSTNVLSTCLIHNIGVRWFLIAIIENWASEGFEVYVTATTYKEKLVKRGLHIEFSILPNPAQITIRLVKSNGQQLQCSFRVRVDSCWIITDSCVYRKQNGYSSTSCANDAEESYKLLPI